MFNWVFQINQLTRIGGSTIKEKVNGIMIRLMSNVVASLFNVYRNKTKMAFAKLPLHQVIID